MDRVVVAHGHRVEADGTAVDPHLCWLRWRLLRWLARSVLLGVGVGAMLGSLVLVAGGRPAMSAVPEAVVGAQLVMGGVLGWAAATNPLGLGYLRSRLRDGAAVAQVGTIVPPVRPELDRFGLRPLGVVTVGPPALEAGLEVHRRPDGVVTALHSPTTGRLTLLSRLDDGRIVVTDDMATVPHQRLVVNVAPGGQPQTLMRSHLAVIERAAFEGCRLQPEGGVIVVEALELEHQGLAGLGALASFFDPTTVGRSLRLLPPLAPADLLALALGPTSPAVSANQPGPGPTRDRDGWAPAWPPTTPRRRRPPLRSSGRPASR